MRRFFASPGSIAGKRVTLRGREAHHLAVVLRLRPGERVIVFDGSGTDRVVSLTQVSAEQVVGQVVETLPGIGAGVHLILVQAVPKGAKMDTVIRMATEVGVAEVIPALTARAVAAGRGRGERWRRIAVEASKQSRRAAVPVVSEPLSFEAAMERAARADLRLILWESARARTIAQALRASGSPARVALIVGPEGGFAEEEIEQAVGRGAIPVTLGPLILRTETAGIVALAMVLYELALRGV